MPPSTQSKHPAALTGATTSPPTRRLAVPLYFAVAITISWVAMAVAAGDGGFPLQPDDAAAVGGAALLGPAAASVLLTAVYDGAAGLRELRARLFRWRVGARWYALALALAPVTSLCVLLPLALRSSAYAPAIAVTSEPVPLALSGLAAGLAVGLFEELGWTGFAAPRLLRARGPLRVGVIVGLVWGLWHFPMFWERDSFTDALSLAVLGARLFAWLPPFRVLMVWIYERTQSLLIVILTHWSLVASLMCLEPTLPREQLLRFILLRAAVLWALVGGVALWRRRRAA
ncbi:MAG: CPBP family intramembrane metalloprotease [Myxococcales bacterium]|nr:CPBP family intramembrane metalloprotease [Myxococcales bacterium]